MARSTPANLFRVAAPATQLLALLSAVVNWSNPDCRWPLLAALVALVVNDVVTFRYHYPRNQLFFTAPLTVESERLDRAAREWASMNLVRVALAFGAWIGAWIAVVRLAHDSRLGL
jgi:uncharacterized membrane protein